MKRRKFFKNSIPPMAALLVNPKTIFSSPLKSGKIKPKRLRKGDSVSLIAPSGPLTEKRLEKAIENMKSLGLKPIVGKNIMAQRGYMAGTDEERLSDLHDAFRDPSTKAVWCVRGGDGGNRLLPFINYDLIRSHPKILIGFSDITAMISAFYTTIGLVSFHGPIASWDFTDYNRNEVESILFEPKANHIIRGNKDTEAIIPGSGEGELIGGNLTLLSVLCGTKFSPDCKNKIVFLEDVGEAPRRIDRMLTQLMQAVNLEEASGIVLGQFVDCEADPEDNSLTLREVIDDRLKPLGIPLVYNFPFGHDKDLCTFPVGIRARLNASEKTITLLEKACS